MVLATIATTSSSKDAQNAAKLNACHVVEKKKKQLLLDMMENAINVKITDAQLVIQVVV